MDEKDAKRLVETYSNLILRVSYTYLHQVYDAEDICQTVFLKYIKSNLQFRSREHEKAWIIRTAINTCKDYLKSSFFKKREVLETAESIPAPEEQNSELLDCVMRLPKYYRLTILLYYYEGYNVEEISNIIGKSESSVSSYLSRGRKKLRDMLTDESVERRQPL